MGLTLVVVGMIAQRIDGSGTIRDWQPISFVAIAQITYILIVLRFLDRFALKALEDFKPVLKSGEQIFPQLKHRISTLPPRATLMVSLFFLLIGTFLSVGTTFSGGDEMTQIQFGPTPFGVYTIIVFLLLWLLNGLFVYHTYHQLKIVNNIYTHHTIVRPFHQRELYAFSGLSTRTGIAIVLMTPLWMVFDPGAASLVIGLTFAMFGVIAFVSPLIGVHRILEEEKARLMDANSRQVEATIASMMVQLQEDNYEGLEKADRALSSLEKARNQIEGISTWPWRSETPHQVILAMFIPLFLWLIQYFLGQLLSG